MFAFFSDEQLSRLISAPLVTSVLLLLISAFLPNRLEAQTSDWTISGADRIDPLVLNSTREKKSADSVIAELQQWYSSAGYFSAQVKQTGPDSISVNEGERYRLESLTVSGPGRDSIAIPENYAASGNDYSDSLIGRVAAILLDSLENQGYLLASLSIDQLLLDTTERTISVNLTLDRGQRLRIGEVNFTGSDGTSRSYLSRVVDISTEQTYNPVRIDRARDRIYRTGLFDRPPFPEVRVIDSGRVELRFALKPRSVNSFDGGIGYQPSGLDNADGFFTGSVDVVLRNIFGGGERIAGSWSKIDESTSDLSFAYSSPWIFGLPFGLDLQFMQRVEEETAAYTSWIERSVQGLATLEIGGEWRIESGIGLAAVIPSPDTSVGPCSDRVLLRSSTLSVLFGIGYDSRDFPLNPRGGSVYRSQFGVGQRSVTELDEACDSLGERQGENGRQTVSVELQHFRTIAWPIVLAGKLNGRLLVGDRIDQSELFRVGGYNSVRGYRAGAFRGVRTGLASIEGRVLLSEYSHVGLFLDGGYVLIPGSITGSQTDRHEGLLGYGATFQVDTPAGVARFSVGLAEGAAVENATISVGLVGSF